MSAHSYRKATMGSTRDARLAGRYPASPATLSISEIGIRMALGAEQHHIVWLVLRETLLLVMLGVAIGLPAALAATRLISSLLFGLTPADPTTIALAIFVMLGVAGLAGYLPANRASRVDPMVALRYE